MRRYMLLVILSLLTSTAFSEESSSPSSSSSSTTSPEQSEFLNHISQLETTRQVLESPQFRECREQAASLPEAERSASVRRCFATKLDQTDDEQITQLRESLGLEGFNIHATQSAVSMRQYLKERLDQALYGTTNTDVTNTKNTRYVGHEVYYELYEAQLGKNVLLEVSTYCLEHLREEDSSGSKVPITPHCTPSTGRAQQCTTSHTNAPPPKFTNNWWTTKVFEEDVVIDPNSGNAASGSAASTPSTGNTSHNISEMMRREFERGPEYLKSKYELCMKAVAKMCLRYECINTVTSAENEECKDLFGSSWPGVARAINAGGSASSGSTDENDVRLDDTGNTQGQKACVLRTKLRDYRKALAVVKETRTQLRAASQGQGVGFDVGIAYNGAYQNGRGANEKSIQEITSVSSEEITNRVENFKEADDRAEDIEQNCTGEELTEECRSHIAGTENDIENIELEIEAGTALEVRRIRELQHNRDDLEAYLRANGLERYIDQIDELTEETLTQMIADKYRAERMAVLNRLKAQLQPRTVENPPGQQQGSSAPPPSTGGTTELQAIQNAAGEIKDTDDRIENILRYNNVISSFLAIKDEDGNDVSTNRASLEIERQGIEQYAEDDERQEADRYLSGFDEAGDSASSSSTSDGTATIDDRIFDLLIYGSVEEEQNPGS